MLRPLRPAMLAILTALPTLAVAAERPNILFLLSDDQRPDTIGALRRASTRAPSAT